MFDLVDPVRPGRDRGCPGRNAGRKQGAGHEK
jgi:hypothetical protein